MPMKLQLSQSSENLGNILWLLSWIFVQRSPLGVWTCAGVDEEDGDEEQGEGGKEDERGEEEKMKKVVMENPMMSSVATT